MKKQTAKLEWLRRLPEAGTIRDVADKEAELLLLRASLLEQVATVDARLSGLRNSAERDAAAQWTAAEIQEAKGGGK